MKFVVLILLLIPIQLSQATIKCHQFRVAIVDSGLDLTDSRFSNHLCKIGHKNFVDNETINDIQGHGSHITGLIEHYANRADYCLLIYKYYSETATGKQNLSREIQAFREAIRNHADIVNFSGGGPEFSEKEYLTILNAPKTIFVVAAGNEGQNLDIPGNEYYPASLWLPNERVVMNKSRFGGLYNSSNWSSRTDFLEIGDTVLSYLPNGQMGYRTGTSQSTAVHTGKLLDKLSNTCYSE